MEWTNVITIEFLKMYQSEPLLWNTPGLKNSIEAQKAWERIKEQLKSVNKNISVEEIKRKRDMLMSTYRKLRKTVKESEESGCETKKIYKPTWPFYKMMSTFLDDFYVPRKKQKQDSKSSDENKGCEDRESGKAIKRTPVNKPFTLETPEKKNINQVTQATDETRSTTEINDQCSLYTDLLCKKLRSLKENTREKAMLEIDTYVYNLKQQDLSEQNCNSQPLHSQPSLGCVSKHTYIPTYLPLQSSQINPMPIAIFPSQPTPDPEHYLQPKEENEEDEYPEDKKFFVSISSSETIT